MADQDEGERRRWVHWSGRLFPCVHPVLEKAYGGKRCVFKEERNKCRVEQDRSAGGREFQMDGAAKEKERRPLADRISGTVSRFLSRDLRFRVGM